MKSAIQAIAFVALTGICVMATVGLLTRTMTAAPATQVNTTTNANGKPVAVVELFTSEGCSSCPPADVNLERISKIKPMANGTVLPLSFHVDYWNHLGWEDPFAKEAFSERQRDYARAAKQNGVYTPQIVVNGKYAFNGSDAALTDKAIQLSLNQPVIHLVDVSVSKSKAEKTFTMNYSVKLSEPNAERHVEADSDLQMNVAVATERECVTVVRGENEGCRLSHVWVVKYFDVRTLTKKGVIEIDSAYVVPGHTRIVAFVQSKTSREITGATAVEL